MRKWLVVSGAAVALVTAVAVWATERKVGLDRVPAAVKATMLKAAGEHRIESVEVITHKGQPTVYEAAWKVGEGVDHEVVVAEDGRLLATRDERETSLDKLPAAAKETILKEAAGSTVAEVTEVTQDQKTTYEAEFAVQRKTVQVTVDPDGKLLGREVQDEAD